MASPIVSKELKHEIRRLAALAHERLLAAELTRLEERFVEWRAGGIDTFELSSLVHRFHEGQVRQLWITFNTNSILTLEVLVGEALQDGTLLAEECSAEALAHLRGRKVL